MSRRANSVGGKGGAGGYLYPEVDVRPGFTITVEVTIGGGAKSFRVPRKARLLTVKSWGAGGGGAGGAR